MTHRTADSRCMEALVDEELRRIKRDNRIRKTLVFTGLLTFFAGLGVATYLAYTSEPAGVFGDLPPPAGDRSDAAFG